MTKTKVKEPTQRAKRNELKAELSRNLSIKSMTVRQRRPWTFVEFETWYMDPKTKQRKDMGVWGVSKICWPDQGWNGAKGVEVATDRALAWAVREIMPPVVE